MPSELLARLRERLDAEPEDARLRQRLARALLRAEQVSSAAELLREHYVNLVAHTAPLVAPCLCAGCIPLAPARCEAGLLDFTVEGGRVLYYWLPRELEGRERRARGAVRARLRRSLWERGALP